MEKIIEQFNKLVSDIASYESDTFSSTGSKLTLDEAKKIASELILININALINHETMDGLMITDLLEDLRI